MTVRIRLHGEKNAILVSAFKKSIESKTETVGKIAQSVIDKKYIF